MVTVSLLLMISQEPWVLLASEAEPGPKHNGWGIYTQMDRDENSILNTNTFCQGYNYKDLSRPVLTFKLQDYNTSR